MLVQWSMQQLRDKYEYLMINKKPAPVKIIHYKHNDIILHSWAIFCGALTYSGRAKMMFSSSFTWIQISVFSVFCTEVYLSRMTLFSGIYMFVRHPSPIC